MLSSVFGIPKLIMQLLSVEKITDCTYNILFIPTSYIVQDHTGRKIQTGRKVNDLYQLEYLYLPSSPHPAMSLSVTSDLWHRRLGHSSSSRLKTLSVSGMLGSFQFSNTNNCEIYRFVKKLLCLSLLVTTWLHKFLT